MHGRGRVCRHRVLCEVRAQLGRHMGLSVAHARAPQTSPWRALKCFWRVHALCKQGRDGSCMLPAWHTGAHVC